MSILPTLGTHILILIDIVAQKMKQLDQMDHMVVLMQHLHMMLFMAS